MYILFVTTLVAVLTFLVVFVFGVTLEKLPIRFGAYKIHHSVFGALLFVVGLVIGKALILSIGLGIYFGHVFEEMYFNKLRLTKALLVFVTRQ